MTNGTEETLVAYARADFGKQIKKQKFHFCPPPCACMIEQSNDFIYRWAKRFGESELIADIPLHWTVPQKHLQKHVGQSVSLSETEMNFELIADIPLHWTAPQKHLQRHVSQSVSHLETETNLWSTLVCNNILRFFFCASDRRSRLLNRF
jgi:hypothetical protein